MLKRILIIVAVLVVALTLFEIFRLLELRSSVGRYDSYWKGHNSDSGQFTYVAIGDSAAQGIGASSPQHSYVSILGKQMSETTGKAVRIINLSVTGATLQDAIDNQLPQLKNYRPDVITVEIGANDVKKWDEEAFMRQYDTLAMELPEGTIVSNLPYFGGISRSNGAAVKANAIITKAAKKYDLKLVDLHAYTAERNSFRNYSADFFHPNDRGYRIWADAFLPVVKEEIKT